MKKPKPKTKMVIVRLSDKEKAMVKSAARDHNMTISDYVRHMLLIYC